VVEIDALSMIGVIDSGPKREVDLIEFLDNCFEESYSIYLSIYLDLAML
jgi:hypothetical protein